MGKVHVKKGDDVYVMTGRDKGKTGKVLEVDTKANRVVVDGVNMVTKHKKPRPPKEEGGIKEEPAAIHASNVRLNKDAKSKDKGKSKTAAKAKDGAAEKKAAPKKKAK